MSDSNLPAGMGNNEVQSVPADFDDMLAYKALIDDSFIYLSVDRNTATYSRYYINDDKTVILGTVDNFYLSTKNAVLIDNTLYFYVSVFESDNGDTSNVLLSINLSENKINNYKNDDNSLAGLLTYQIDGNIITLKNVVDEENITTYLDIFDVNSKSWKLENINVVDSNTKIGSAIFGLYSNKEAVYVLHDECLGKGNVKTTLKVYDINMNEIQTINIANDLRDYILSSRIQEMAVFGNHIYTQNTSNYSLLGKIEGNTIEPIIKERNLSLALNQTSPNTPFFYVRRSNKCYILDTETETIIPIDLQIGNEYTIRCILADEKNILLECYSNDNKTHYMYYLKRDNLSNTYIPCE